MGLKLRQQLTDTNGSGISITGTELTYAQGDSNFIYLLSNMSGSTISITGSTVGILGNTTITNNLTVGGTLFATSSWADNATTASFITASKVWGPFGTGSVFSSSYASGSTSSSYSITSSYIPGSIFTSLNPALTSSYSITASYITGAFFTGDNIAASSSLSLTASYFSGSISNAQVAAFATTAATASYITNGHVRAISSADTRVLVSGSGGGSGSVIILLNMTGSGFSQNGQIVAFINGLANLF